MTINLDHVTEQITVTDTAANASLTVNPKGTGAFNVAAGSGGLNLSNGGTVTAITRTATGSGYTSFPSLAISAPTTAGGVQATASVAQMLANNPTTVQAGGTGYTVGDVLTVVGGTPVSGGATFTVSSVSGGVVTAVTATNFANYTALPTNPVTTTGGTGTGCTLNVTYSVQVFFTITNAGSGYVEQPTITFSGGGGSGATAYATVGSNTSVKSLGTSLLFYTPAGVQGQFSDSGGSTPTAYPNLNGSSFGLAYLTATGSAANAGLVLASKGASAVGIYTNSTGSQAASFSHTASAVNYVQATGAVTGGNPVISAQGSDTNVGLAFLNKGTSAFGFRNDATASALGLELADNTTVDKTVYIDFHSSASTDFDYRLSRNPGVNGNAVYQIAGTGSHVFYTGTTANQLTAVHTASAVNWLQVSGAATGGNPYVSAQGSDTNVSLTLSTKGTGGFQFAANGNSVFTGNGGTHFRVRTDLASATGFWEVFGTTGGPIFRSTATTGLIQTSGGQLSLQTDTSGTTQLAVAHTASAVNYLQVTGGSTGNVPIISAQGSDTNISLQLRAKGTGAINFMTQGGLNQAVVFSNGDGTNFLAFRGGNTGVAPSIIASGSDTNIPLVLQPKGTGALQAQQTDSTATGGNARGTNAVDWQTTRSAASQVASGSQTLIAGGNSNTAAAFGSAVVGGSNNSITGGAYNAILGGISNTTGSSGQGITMGGGHANSALGFFNFVGGGFTNSGTSGSTVTTQSATMNGTTAVTLSASNASIKVGQLISGTSIATYPHTYVAAISGTSLTLSQAASGSSTSTLSFLTPHGVVVGGGNNQATGSYSFIGGGGDAGTAGNRNVASGDWSTVGGGWKNTASALFSGSLSGTNNISSGIGSVVCGGGTYGSITQVAGNIASGLASFVGAGFSNTASSNASFIGAGAVNTSNGIYSAVIAGNNGTTRSIWGNHVIPALNPFSSPQGSSQSATLVLGKQTTDATATVLTCTAGAPDTVNQVILPNNSAYFFTGEVVAGVTGGGNTKGWTIEGVIKRGANAASTALVGTPTVTSTYADAGASTWVIAVTADTTNGGLAVTFTGQASTTIRTVCQVRTTEMTY